MTMNRCHFKWVPIMLAIILAIPANWVHAATNVDVTLTKNDPVVILSSAGERIFDIDYSFDVSYNAVTTGLDLVIVLDRSNSMLMVDPSTEKPVADAVWAAVNGFVTDLYRLYPASNVAIVSFGTNGNKSDNWKYDNNLSDVLDEIEDVYDYRDLDTNYHKNFKHYKENGYRFAWENWQISDGATNIKAAFDYAENTVNKKKVKVEENGNDVILLFTDGVATQGGDKSQENLNYPLIHNTNTQAAYLAGQNAQSVADVITIGYFEAISENETKNIARETLSWSQNAGEFEAAETGDLTSIFDEVITELNFVGTSGTVTEVVEPEFEVIESSITPKNYKLTTEEDGSTTIVWSLGNVTETTYALGYQVKVKDHVYPTGSGTIKIPINEEAVFTYLDLEGNQVTEDLGHAETTIPTRGDQPILNVSVVYDSNQYGYLVGDNIHITHNMSFANVAPLDYKSIHVGDLVKMMTGGAFGTDVEVSPLLALDWPINNEKLYKSINDTKTAGPEENLTWSQAVELTLVPKLVGTYALSNSVDYALTNSAGLKFEFATSNADPSVITVKEGALHLTLMDDKNTYITEPMTVEVNETAISAIADGDTLVAKGITSGTHTFRVALPSGYELSSDNPDITINDGVLSFTGTLDFDNPILEKTINFNRLKIKGIGVTNRSGGSGMAIEQASEKTDAIVKFELVRPLTVVELTLQDDYGPSNHQFDLDKLDGQEARVENALGEQINGFEMIGSTLAYSGPELPVGKYKAYGVITPPDTLGDDLDYEYEVEVVTIKTKESSDVSPELMNVTSTDLLISMDDTEAPLIVAQYMEADSSTNKANHDISVTDKTIITEVKIYEGEQTLLTRNNPDVVEVVFDTLADHGESRSLDANIKLQHTIELGKIVFSGTITIYAKDAFENEGILVVNVINESINDFIEENLQ